MDKAQLVVVGGGQSGASAAIEAAKWGVQVCLVDENPLDFSMMGLDIPLYFGQRMMPTLRDKGLMLQRVVSSSDPLKEAQEAGVETVLGTCVWGSFRNQENSRQLEKPVLGLADEERSWLLEYDCLVLAPGARDLVLGFPGRDLVGVMGANAVASLLNLYQGLAAKRMVVLGSGDLGMLAACQALEHGVQVAAIVDVSSQVQGNGRLRAELEGQGVPFYTSHTVKEARGLREVESIVISQIDDDFRSIDGTDQELECDTVCLAVGLVPNVELLYLTGCQLSYRADLGGFVPDRDDRMQTSIERVYVVGDAGGFYDDMTANADIAVAQGKIAGIAVAEYLGILDGKKAASQIRGLKPKAAIPDGGEAAEYRAAWLSSLVAAGGMNVNVCQCEEVTRGDLIKVAAPGYLGWSSEEMDRRSLETLLEEGSVDLDRLKRLTRAGMGYCQGRRCREETAMLVARAAGIDVSQIPMASYRPPVRPLPLKVMWPQEEPEELRQSWYYWIKEVPKTLDELREA
ncbi:MAG: FAD-dependent oxidoreductase [Dehalococcoidia bacterium]